MDKLWILSADVQNGCDVELRIRVEFIDGLDGAEHAVLVLVLIDSELRFSRNQQTS